MGSIRIIRVLGLVLFLVPGLSLGAQNASPQSRFLAADIERLEKENAGPGVKPEILKSLARLYQLSGSPEKALTAWSGAARANPAAPDCEALLEVSRILVSLGDYEKARAELGVVFQAAGNSSLILQARLLSAQLEAFSQGDTRGLAQLASEPAFVPERSGIYYTLWKISGDDSWKTRLLIEFPHSPEARLAGASKGIEPAATPQWLLFPGQMNNFSVSSASSGSAPAPAAQTPPASVPPAPPPAAASSSQTMMLQTGLFSREENAKAMTERLGKAGFQSRLIRRRVNNADYWAVMVDGGADPGKTITALKNAGFESFLVIN